MITIEFNKQLMPQNLIDVEDIGNVCLEAVNEDDGFFYYLLIKTYAGVSTTISYGPVVPDVALLPDEYSLEFKRMNFKDTSIIKFISFWLNDRSKNITSAQVIDETAFIENIKDMKNYIENYGEEIY